MCRMEVVCDDFLYIWHVMFGTPGSKNDINIMDQSPLFNAVRNGRWPPIRPETSLNGLALNWYYYLTDGIYPRFRIFVSSIQDPSTKKEKRFCAQQEGVRKGVEREFRVLFQRFRIIYQPSRLWYKEDMNSIVKACCILHNMIVKRRKHLYTGTKSLQFVDEDTGLPSEVSIVTRGEGTYEQAAFWRKLLTQSKTQTSKPD